jgi:hypothetical protein
VQPAPASPRRTTVRVGLLVLGVVVVLSVAELTSQRFSAFVQDHSLIWTFITEGILLVGAYLVIDEIIQRRESRRWSDVRSLGIRALSSRAEGPAEIVRRAVNGLVVEPKSNQPSSRLDTADAARSGSAGYEEFVSGRVDELADWLRADAGRAHAFAQEMRQSASGLEEAIIRWGPTLVEDPESAELINLLPDIVDSARSAADTITPAAGWFDPARREDEILGATEGWRDGDHGDRQLKDSLLDILQKADEFQRRVSPQASQGR